MLKTAIVVLLFLFMQLAIISCATTNHHSSSREPSGAEDVSDFDKLFQLGPQAGGLDLDAWTEGFFGAVSSKDLKGLSSQIVKVYNETTDVRQVYQFLLPYSHNYSNTDPSKYFELADSLLAARRAVRQDLNYTRAEIRLQTMYLLESLSEDTLYVANIKFPKKQVWQKTFISDSHINPLCVDVKGQKRASKFPGFSMTVCPGDIMLTKGGEGSSSFLSRVSDYPGNFSHAALVYIEPPKGATIAGKNSQILSPEAWIEDGVLLRDPVKNDYVGKTAKMKKLFVYRFKGSPSQFANVIDGVDGFLSQMKSRQPEIMTKPSFDYDFAFEADDSTRFFCSEVPYFVYKNVSAKDATVINAYPKENWGKVHGATQSFFKNFLNVTNTEFPSPSDLELNSKFELVGLQFNIAGLAHDRVDVALIDSLILMAKANPDLVEEYSYVFKKAGNTPVNLEQLIGRMHEAGILKDEQVDSLKKKMGGAIPKAINPKQVIFFAYLNQVLTPKVRAHFAKYYEPHSVADRVGSNALREEMRQYVASELATLTEQLKKSE